MLVDKQSKNVAQSRHLLKAGQVSQEANRSLSYDHNSYWLIRTVESTEVGSALGLARVADYELSSKHIKNW